MRKKLLQAVAFLLPLAFCSLSGAAQVVTDPSSDPAYDSTKLQMTSSFRATGGKTGAGGVAKSTASASKQRIATATTTGTSGTTSNVTIGCLIPRDATYTAIDRNDDGSYGPINLPFDFNLYGTKYRQVWINTNGNLTFTGPYAEFVASGFPMTVPMVAGYWSDVDTRPAASGDIAYKLSATNLIVTWQNVGYYPQITSQLNTFQIIIGTSTDPLLGIGQNVSLRYGDMQWATTGGSGGPAATVGINDGNGTDYVQVGRFQTSTATYDGPGGNTDGVNYLDMKCFNFNVSSSGNIPPSANNLPANNTIGLTAGQTVTINPQFLAPEVNQNTTLRVDLGGLCNATSTVTNGTTASAAISITGAACNVGTHVITLTATDNGSPVQTTTVTLNVVVTAPTPVALAETHVNETCPGAANGSINLQVTNGTGATYAWTGPNGFRTSAEDLSGLRAGTYSVTVTTPNNGSASTSVAIAVADHTAPTALAKNISVQLDASGNASITGAQVNNGSTDNCSVASVTVTPAAFTCANVGDNPVTLTVTDASGNVSTAAATVTVLDRIAPTAVAQNVTVQLDATGNASVTAAQVNNGSADACGIATVTVSPSTFTCADLGAKAVILTVTDRHGNVSTAPATVTVVDRQLPTIAAPAAVTVSTDAGQCTATHVALGSADAADNCGAAITNDAPTAFLKGTTIVTWTATDASGNVATATQLVTVVDTERPTISAPAAVTVSADAGQCRATQVALGSAAFGDNCSGVMSVTNDAPVAFLKGSTTVTWTATDASGNVATATQVVTVVDTERPTISAPAALTVSTDAGQCAATHVALGQPLAGDNCGGVRVTNNAPSSFSKGTTTVTWTATDAEGLTATATQVVTVSDTELPTITAPAAVSVSTDARLCSASGVALGSAAFGDNCANAVLTNNAPTTFPKGTTTVTWTVTDASGNVATATQLVTVTDAEKPVLTVPANITVSAPASQCGAVVNFNAAATDNCGAALAVSMPSGSTFPVGTTTVTLSATDASNNTSTGSFTVTVNDVTAPTALTRPVELTLVNGMASLTTAQVNNGSSDACGIKSMSLSKTSFDCSNIGDNTVTLTVTDNHNLVSTATAAVKVRGDVPVVTVAATPAAVNQGRQVVLYLGYGAPSATLTASSGALSGVRYTWSGAPGLSTTSGASTVFTPTTEGIYSFAVTATSATGCTATAPVKVYVEDVRCGNNNDKVQVCHNGNAICVSYNALNTHLGHGDVVGDCAVRLARPSTTNEAPAADLAANELSAFPNPLADNATVTFRTALSGPAQVLVYNQLGQRVATLYDGAATAGELHTLTLKSQTLATGLYVCRLVTNGKTETLRLTIAW
jgi:hypothetical protein